MNQQHIYKQSNETQNRGLPTINKKNNKNYNIGKNVFLNVLKNKTYLNTLPTEIQNKAYRGKHYTLVLLSKEIPPQKLKKQ